MTGSSSFISVAPRTADRLFTGPMSLAGLALCACAVTRSFGLDHAGVSFCYFKALTGYACFTCGTTRALGHLARFDLAAAFAIQPLVTTATLGLFLWGLLDAALLMAGRRTRIRVEGRAWRVTTLVVLVLATLNWFYLLKTGV